MSKKRIISVFVFVFIMCMCIKSDVHADNVFLTQTEISIYEGDSISLADFVPESYRTGASYTIDEESDDSECVRLESDGTLNSLYDGDLVVDVTVNINGVSSTDEIVVNIILPQEINAACGDNTDLAAYSNSLYSSSTFVTDDASVTYTGTGNVRIDGFNGGTVYAVKNNGSKITVANVAVNEPYIKHATVVRAINTDGFRPLIEDYTAAVSIKYDISDNTIVTADNGFLYAKTTGSCDVKATLVSACGQTKELDFKYFGTDPSISKNEYIVAKGAQFRLEASGIASESAITSDIDSEYVSFDYMLVSGIEKGTDNVTIHIDGREFIVKFIVTNPAFKTDEVLLYPGKSYNMTFSGINTNSDISYEIEKKSYASVTSNGKVKAKKYGSTKLIVVVDYKTLELPVEVTTKTAYYAVKREMAIANTKTHYSQAYRMSKGLYDCSSLVWRSYSKYGVYFSNSRYAPTAAGIAYWCACHKKVISYKPLSNTSKLRAGDLIFFAFAGNNGRYRHISHVETYVGGGMDISASSSHNKVIKYGSLYNNECVVMIARPTR